MNKQFYRTKFNAKLGTYVAVSELAKSHQGDTSPRIKASIQSNHDVTETSIAVTGQRTLKQLVLALSTLMAISPIYANVVVNNNAAAAHKATVLKEGNAANVWITAPSASGVSRNSYTQFDVNQNGVILNNSRGAATSQITKTSIAANPNLAKGAATTIVNEVVSSNPSLLQGNLEVLGSRANVVIANPTGITVNGGGFINANQVTLSTGVLGYNSDGSIKDHTVKQGAITINPDANNRGLGGNANNPVALELLGRSIAINAPVNADTITAVTGANAITAETGAVTTTAGTGVVPMVAIDVAQLGGLYANSIYLHANEAGVGVNNAGVIQAQNNVVLNSNGKIEHKGTISSTSKTEGLVNIKTMGTGVAGDINTSGSINSNSIISIDSGNNLNVNGKEIKVNLGGVTASPLLISTKGDLNLAANSRIYNDSSSGNLYINAGNINLATNSELTSNRGSAYIQSQKDIIAVQDAKLIAVQDLNVSGKGKLAFTGNLLHATLGSINLQADSSNTQGLIDIQNGTINAGKDLDLYSSGDVNLKSLGLAVENGASRVKNINAYSGQNLTWEHTGTALPQISGKVQLDAANQLNLLNGTLSAKDNINLQANQLVLGSTLTSDKSINITSKVSDLTLSHALTAKGDINASATVGSLTTSGLKATSHDGKLSLMANKNLTLTHAGPTRSILLGAQGVNIASVGDGDVTSSSTDLYSSQGNILVSSNLKNTLTDTTLNATKNIEVFAKDNLTLDGLITLGRAHTALSSKKNIYINSIAGAAGAPVDTLSPQSQFNSNGVLSITSGKNINVQNARLTAGALLIEAGESLNSSKSMELNATGSDLLKNDTKLNSLNGDLSIQTGSDLVIDPTKHKLSAVGDIDLVSKNGALILKGYGGTAGNGSEKVVSLNTVNGGINLQGNKVELQGSQLTSNKNINIVSNNGDLVVDGVKNKFTNLLSSQVVTNLNDTRNSFNVRLQKLLSNADYIQKKNKARIELDKAIDVLKQMADEWFPMGAEFYMECPRYDLCGKEVDLVNKLQDKYDVITQPETSLYAKIEEIDEEIKTFNTNKFSGYEHSESSLDSLLGDVNIVSSKGILVSGGNVTSRKGKVNIEARGILEQIYTSTAEVNGNKKILNASIIMDGHNNFYDRGNEGDVNYSFKTLINPTIINGSKGVHIQAIGITKNDNLIMQATGLISKNGDVRIEANQNILFDAAVEQSYDRSTTTEKKRSWGGLKKKYITTKNENNDIDSASVDIQGKNIFIESKMKNPNNSIDIYSGNFSADGGEISIRSGGNLNFYTVKESSSSKTDVTKKSSFAGIKYNDSKTSATRNQISEIPAILKADYIGTKSGFDTRLVGTEFEYLKGATIEAGGTLSLLVAKQSISELTKNESNSVVWQSMQDKGSVTETAKLPNFNGLTPPTFIANGGLTVQVPIGEKDQNKVEIRNAIIQLSNQKGNEYLKELITRKDVDWQKVILTQQNWDYKSQGLTGAGAAIIAIIVAIATYGAGTALVGAAGTTTTAVAGGGTITTFGGMTLATTSAAGLTTYTATGAMINAALTSIATQSSISLLNNGGDLSQTLKDLGSKDSVKSLVTSVITVGLMDKLNTGLDLKLDNPTLANRAINNFVEGVGSTLISTSIQGGDLSDNLQKALLAGLGSTLQGQLATQIKGLEDVNYLLHKIAHAAAGCIAGAIQKSCEAGAIGAAVGEVIASSITTPDNFTTFDELEKHQRLVRDISKLTAGVVAAYAGYDVNIAVNSAETAVRNNRQLNEKEIKSIDLLAKGDSAKKDRLTIAACALIKCSAGLDPNSVEYKMLIQIENLGNTSAYKTERDLLKQQKFNYDYAFLGYTLPNMKGSDQLFTYTTTDSGLDAASRFNAKYSIGTRAGGILLVAGGVAGGAVSTGGLVTCATGLGCILAGTGLVTSADIASTGLQQVIQGKPQNTLGAMAISEVTGISLETSENIYALLNMGATIQQIGTGLKVAAQNGVTTLPKVENVQRVCSSGPACFVAGTLIETDKGFKRIEEFVGGELVWSKDELTQEYDYRSVIGTKITENQTIYKIVVKDENNINEVFYTTEEHPFWIKDSGWLKASLLSNGMQLLNRNNEVLNVLSQERLAHIDTVYNIEVDQYNTYHVGKLGVWVHNAACCNIVQKKLKYEIEVNGDGFYKKYDVSTRQLFDKNGIPVDKRFETSYLYSSFNETKGEFYIEKMAAFQSGNYTGREMLSVAIERIGLDNIKMAKAQLADTNKAAFQTAMINTTDPIKAVAQTPLGKAMNDLGFKVATVRDVNSSLPWVEFVRK